jgi:hypothetical protein
MEDPELAAAATELVAALYQAGVPRNTPPLRSPWQTNVARFAPHVVLLAAIPLILAAVAIYAPRKTGGSPTTFATAGAAVDPGTPAEPAAGAAPTPTAPTVCANDPASGTILGGVVPAARFGHSLEIKNGLDGPVIVKVRDAGTGRLIFSFFVQKSDDTTVSGFRDGTYKVQYAVGAYLADDCRTLGNILNTAEFPGEDTFTTQHRRNKIVTQSLSYTLYPVPNGNVHPDQISLESFNRD